MNDVDSQNNLEKGQSLQLTMISRINYKAIVKQNKIKKK